MKFGNNSILFFLSIIRVPQQSYLKKKSKKIEKNRKIIRQSCTSAGGGLPQPAEMQLYLIDVFLETRFFKKAVSVVSRRRDVLA